MSRPYPSPPAGALRRPVTLAEAADLGLSRAELSTGRWHRLGRGVRVHNTLDATDPLIRIEAALAWLPDWAVLGGWAALRWQGARWLDGRTGPGSREIRPILVHVGTQRHLRQRDGFVIDRSRLDSDDVRLVQGARVTVAARAVLDEMCRFGIEEGLAAGDAAVASGLTTPRQVAELLDGRGRTPGIPTARIAVPLLDGAVRSPPESRFRYVWIVEADLPRPLVNRRIVDEEGWLVGIADLVEPDAGVVGEYDGGQHRELRHHTSDNVREEGLEGLNLVVVRATSVDLWSQRERLVARLQAAHRRGLARDRTKDRFLVQRP